jgi:hypothetical protein
LAVNDYNKKKNLEVTSQNNSGTTQDKAQPILVKGEATNYSISRIYNEFSSDFSSDGPGLANITGLEFADSGLKMYFVTDNDDVFEYTLSTAYDFSSATFVNSIDISSEDTSMNGIAVVNSGNTLQLSGNENSSIYQYNLTTAFDISTASLQDTTSVNSETSSPEAIRYNNDGSKLFIADNSNNRVLEYSVGTAYDSTTLTFSTSFSSNINNSLQSVCFNNDGTKMYVTSIFTDSLISYNLSTAFDITSASINQELNGAEYGGNSILWSDTGESLIFATGVENLINYKVPKESKSNTGSVVVDWSNISSESNIAIYDQDGNLLPYEIESFDATAETATLWCYNSWTRDDSAQAQVVYGNGPAGSEENVVGTWNNTGQNAEMVYHLDESSGQTIDSTSSNRDSTSTTGTTYQETGQFNGARGFDGTDDGILLGDGNSSPIAGSTSITMVASASHDLADNGSYRYYNIHDTTGADFIFGQFEDLSQGNVDWGPWILVVDNDGTRRQLRGSTTGSDLISSDTFYHTGMSWTSGSGFNVYLDGSDVTSDLGVEETGIPSQVISDANEGEGIGAQIKADGTTNGNFMDGEIDDLRIYSDDKDAAWHQAEYDGSPKGGQVYFSQQAAETTSLEIAAETSTVTASNPEPGVNATGTTTIQGQASTITSSNPNPSVNPSGTATITAQQSTLTASTPNASVNGTGTATLNAQTSTLTASTPEPNLTKADAINAPVSTITTSNPEPQISGTGNTDLNAETSTLTTTTPQPTIDATGTTTIQAQESSLQASNPEPQISGSGTVTVQAEESSLNIFNPEPEITIALQPRDTSFTTNIKTETDKTLSGDIDK